MEISYNYNLGFVALSIFIAIVGSYSVLGVFPSVIERKSESKFTALIAGGLMGFGIWSMHFIAMKAVTMNVEINYDILITILSILPAALGAGIAFYTVTFPVAKRLFPLRLVLSSLILAVSISVMHYTGMAAMIMPARINYNLFVVILSVVVAFLASYMSLKYFIDLSSLRPKLRKQHVKIIAATLMGLAISSMHYTGMFATSFISDSSVSNSSLLSLDSYATYGLAFYCALMLILTSLIVGITVKKPI